MGYTPEMKELIKRVEKTRPERLNMARRNEHFPDLSLSEREEILKRFHPDYMEEGRRAVRVGPNKGEVFPEEVVDLLESRSRIDPKKVNLKEVAHECDILVIGGGGAGTAAALVTQELGLRVTVATKLRH
jgi:succinate dehydrogenase / fumarate reductase flavoprotein subunit/L-aspartate oxidase